MDIELAIESLCYHVICNHLESGASPSQIKQFYNANPGAGKALSNIYNSDDIIQSLCNDYPNLFIYDIYDRNRPLLHLATDSKMIKKNATLRNFDKSALKFYIDRLRDNDALRNECENINTLKDEIYKWKDEEKTKGRFHKKCSPSTIILSLRKAWKFVGKQVNGNIVWKTPSLSLSPSSSSSSSVKTTEKKGANNRKLNKKKRQQQQLSPFEELVKCLNDNREVLEQNRYGVQIDAIDFGLGFSSSSSSSSEEGKMLCGLVNQTLHQNITIVNNNHNWTNGIQVEIKDSLAKKQGFEISGVSKSDGKLIRRLRKGETTTVSVSFTPTTYGVTKCVIPFCISNADDTAAAAAASTTTTEKELVAPSSSFVIVRYVTVRIGNSDDQNVLKVSSPYDDGRRRRKVERGGFSNAIPVEAPPSSSSSSSGEFVEPLDSYRVPQYWRDMDRVVALTELFAMSSSSSSSLSATTIDDASSKNDDETTTSTTTIDYSQHLTPANYAKIFHRLLWTEEIQMEIDIRNYDLAGAPMKKAVLHHGNNRQQHHHQQQLYTLSVPGLAEKRPSVLRGDRLTIRLSSDVQRRFEGYVNRTERDNVILSFPKAFSSAVAASSGNGGAVTTTTTTNAVDVRFRYNRMTIRISHHTLDSISRHMSSTTTNHDNNNMINRMLFPMNDDDAAAAVKELLHLPPLFDLPNNFLPYNKSLNPEQRAAVCGILRSTRRPSPYIIYGPPGTGKTVTLVESLLQTLKPFSSSSSSSSSSVQHRRQSMRILVCAPSNSAIDLIAMRLAPHLSPAEMIRLVAYSRGKETIPEELSSYVPPYNNDGRGGGFTMPPIEDISQKRVVAVTLSTGGKLPCMGLRDHFTHVFIDEAGHAIEPELVSCLIDTVSIGDLKNPPVVVIAGDPQQLGPIVRSPTAIKFGLGTSYLERLSKMAPYCRRATGDDEDGMYDSALITKLIRNYRSHPSLLTMPNALFYDGDLIPAGDRRRTHHLADWEHLPTKGFPLVFVGVQGQDCREGNSPSWFNPDEASLVKHYVDLLLSTTAHGANNSSSIVVHPADIGIVTPYRKQAQKLRALLRHQPDVSIGSVDEFQGSERQVIIVSTVRSSHDYVVVAHDEKHSLGFVKHPKRFNVAVTRAQALLVVVGNPYVLETDGCWGKLLDYAVDNGGYTGCEYKKKDSRTKDTYSSTKGDWYSSFLDAMKVVTTLENKKENETQEDSSGVILDAMKGMTLETKEDNRKMPEDCNATSCEGIGLDNGMEEEKKHDE